MKIKTVTLAGLLLLSPASYADVSATVTTVSDYLFNGVSQTQEDPAIQGSLDWAGDSGWYAGSWGSTVDFSEVDIEWDFYVGRFMQLTDNLSVDLGIAQYTYHGDGGSSDFNYPEVYAKWGYYNSEINFWYTWDYFGTGAGHYIVMFNQHFPVTDDFSIMAGVDFSQSMDSDKYVWEPGDKNYFHWQLTGNYSYGGFDMSLGVQGTDIDTYGDTTILFTIGRTFQF